MDPVNDHGKTNDSRPGKASRFLHTDEIRQKIGLFLGPLLFLAGGYLLKQRGLTPEAAWAGATVAWMSCWWICEPVPLWATACLPLFTFPVFSNVSLAGVALQYFDSVNFLFLGGMLIAACMEEWGLHRRIALGIISKIGASPRLIILGFMIGTAFISMWISNTAAAMMMFPIAMAVLNKFRDTEGRSPLIESFGLALMLGVAYAASIGGIGTKIGTGTNLVFVKSAREVLNQEIDFLTWAKIGMPVVIIAIPLVWFYLVRFGARVPAVDFPGGKETIEAERKKLGRMNGGEIAAAIGFSCAALLWIFRKDIELGAFTIPGWWRLVTWSWNDLLPLAGAPDMVRKAFADTGDAAVAMVIALILFFVPVRRKPQRMALAPAQLSKVGWGLLVLLGGGFAMAYGIQASGLSTEIARNLQSLGKLPPFLLTVCASIGAVALTEVASNTATASILLPIMAASASSFGLEPLPLMLTITMASSFGFMLPAGTPPNAIAFASGCITVPQMVRCGFIVDIFGAVLVSVLAYYLAPLAMGH